MKSNLVIPNAEAFLKIPFALIVILVMEKMSDRKLNEQVAELIGTAQVVVPE